MIELVELVYLWIDGTMSLNIYHLCSRIASAGTLRIERCVPRSSLIPSFVWVPSPFDGPQILCGGFHSHGGTPIAGWLLEKIPNSNGWLGVHDSANLHVCFLIPSTVMTPKIWWMWYIFKGDFLIPPGSMVIHYWWWFFWPFLLILAHIYSTKKSSPVYPSM